MVALQAAATIDSWHEVIRVHPGLQLTPDELLLPTRTVGMSKTLPSLRLPSADSMVQPTDPQAAIAQAAVAVAMAQSQPDRVRSPPHPP